MPRRSPAPSAPRLLALRADVDRINVDLVRTLQQRARLVARVAALKRRLGIPIADVARERAMLRAALEAAGTGFPRSTLARILRCVFDESRRFAARAATSRRAPARRA
ncbi:MAG: chorismate mutase [Planctomycetes bacterium]|nr:chorismate mutase [Planctomycetota bacterium]MCC7169726.1 chorismate mutase [Planctomycetota bacterium]